jgi:hypothetical protein
MVVRSSTNVEACYDVRRTPNQSGAALNLSHTPTATAADLLRTDRRAGALLTTRDRETGRFGAGDRRPRLAGRGVTALRGPDGRLIALPTR